MRISDWSSDVCSSDLHIGAGHGVEGESLRHAGEVLVEDFGGPFRGQVRHAGVIGHRLLQRGSKPREERESGVWGTSVSVRVDRGVRRSIKKNTTTTCHTIASKS